MTNHSHSRSALLTIFCVLSIASVPVIVCRTVVWSQAFISLITICFWIVFMFYMTVLPFQFFSFHFPLKHFQLFTVRAVATDYIVFVGDFFYCFVSTITHKPLHSAWWTLAGTCILTTARNPENFKIIGQRSKTGFSDSLPLRDRAKSLCTR